MVPLFKRYALRNMCQISDLIDDRTYPILSYGAKEKLQSDSWYCRKIRKCPIFEHYTKSNIKQILDLIVEQTYPRLSSRAKGKFQTGSWSIMKYCRKITEIPNSCSQEILKFLIFLHAIFSSDVDPRRQKRNKQWSLYFVFHAVTNNLLMGRYWFVTSPKLQ